MRDKNPYVVVCVPNTGAWCNDMAKSTVLLFSYFGINQVPGVRSQKMGLLTIQGSMIAAQRHILVKKACQTQEVTHVLFIDADMEFPKNTAHRLLAADKDVVACNCTTRMEPIVPVAFDFDGQRISSVGRHGLEKVRQVGPAVMLIRTDMLRKLRPPLFLQDWIPDMEDYCGEDVFFCQVVQAAGYDIWVDHDLSREIKHVGARGWGYDDVKLEDVEKTSVPFKLIKQGVG